LDGQEEEKFDVDSILKTCWGDGSIYDAMDLGKSIPINASEMFPVLVVFLKMVLSDPNPKLLWML
jgi:hypothetical protein